jgi:transposase
VVPHWPTHCRGCQAPLAQTPEGEPVRHQVTELPPVRDVVTEHQLQHVRCGVCGTTTGAILPPDVPPGAFGPRLQATVAVLAGRYRLSRARWWASARTGWARRWRWAAWTACAWLPPERWRSQWQRSRPPSAAGSRRPCRRDQLAGSRATVLVVGGGHGGGDRLHARPESGQWRHQRPARGALCRLSDQRPLGGLYVGRSYPAASLLGAPQARFPETGGLRGPGRAIGQDALRWLGGLFGAWAERRADPTQRERFGRRARQYPWRLRRVLERGQHCGCERTANVSTALLKLWPALWTFVTVPGIEPTNNAAEQAIRPAVLWRKGSFGTQSAAGSLFVTRLLSVAATCRQQERSLLAYLTAVCAAAHAGHPIPSLLPTPPLALPDSPVAQAA